MPAEPSRRVVLWDAMGTLVHDPFYVEVPRFFGLTLEALIEAKHPSLWVEFELGRITEHQMLAGFFADGRTIDGDALKATMRGAYRWLDGMQELLAELKARGAEMHVMSNYPPWYRMIEDAVGIETYAAWTFVSCNTGLRKPDPNAYAHVGAALGVSAAACLLVDDREVNCEGARAAGMAACHFVDGVTLRAELGRLHWL